MDFNGWKLLAEISLNSCKGYGYLKQSDDTMAQYDIYKLDQLHYVEDVERNAGFEIIKMLKSVPKENNTPLGSVILSQTTEGVKLTCPGLPIEIIEKIREDLQV